MTQMRISWMWGAALVTAVLAGGHPQPTNSPNGTVSGSEGLTSMFSPRMDFEQWKPLTGRGDPLRNDPTYDYEPPVLERVHYWADERDRRPERDQRPDRQQVPAIDQRVERDQRPERVPHPPAGRDVLVLGVAARRPSSVAPRPTPLSYEDFTYRLGERYPVTILVPPPPPPVHHPPLFVPPLPPASMPAPTVADTTLLPENLSSFYALQESNLIYQSSSTHSWSTERAAPAAPVSGDYQGWGPTTTITTTTGTPLRPDDAHNLVPHEHAELTPHPYAFYKPMLSEAPPPPQKIPGPVMLPTFLPTVLPPTSAADTTQATTTALPHMMHPTAHVHVPHVLDEPTQSPPLAATTSAVTYQTTAAPPTTTPKVTTPKMVTKVGDMLSPMMSMPLGAGPDTLEDNLYAFASQNVQVFKQEGGRRAPPSEEHPSTPAERPPAPFYVEAQAARPAWPTPPYASRRPPGADAPMYLIIQGHSKVKTYSSKPEPAHTADTITNEIPKPVFSDQVKHLHTKKSAKQLDTTDVNQRSKAKSLQSLLDHGYGSIEIQEADLGIQYDVSDGGLVPAEIYRRGVVHADPGPARSRLRRQIELEDLLPFDEDDVEEYIYKFLESRKNETGITGLIAQAVTGDGAAALDELEEDAGLLEDDR